MGRRCACAILTPDVVDRREGGHLETDLSAQQPSPQADARVPGADADPQWPCRDLAAAQEGTQAPERLMAGGSRPPAAAGPGAGERLPPARRSRRRRRAREKLGDAAVDRPPRLLQAPAVAAAAPFLPLLSHLLGICPAGAAKAWALARFRPGGLAAPALSALCLRRDRFTVKGYSETVNRMISKGLICG